MACRGTTLVHSFSFLKNEAYFIDSNIFFTYGCMGQSIQEWTKKNLWKTAFKKFERIWSASYVCLS